MQTDRGKKTIRQNKMADKKISRMKDRQTAKQKDIYEMKTCMHRLTDKKG